MKKLIVFFANINELIMLKHTIFALPFLGISIIISLWLYDYNIDVFTILFTLLAVFSARSFAMSVNRFLDMDIDIKNPRTQKRPSVDGRIPKNMQIFLIIVYSTIFVLSTFYINKSAFYLSVPVLFILGFYSYTKRFTCLSHIFLGLSLGLAPLAGDIAISGDIHIWSSFLGLGVVFWVAGFDVLYSMQDINFDKKEGLFSVPSRFGIKKAFLIVHILHILATLFWYLFVWYLPLSFMAWCGLSFSIIMLIYENKIARDSIKNINKAFFTINGYLGIVFFVSILADVMM